MRFLVDDDLLSALIEAERAFAAIAADPAQHVSGVCHGLAEDAPIWGDGSFGGNRVNLVAERILNGQEQAMGDEEIVGVLLYLALPTLEGRPLSQALVTSFGSLGAVLAASDVELERAGVPDRAIQLFRTVRHAVLRTLREPVREKPIIGSSAALDSYLSATLRHERREQVRILFLDRKNHLLRDEIVAQGTIDHAPLYPREVVRHCLDHNASAIILVHNHPSGDPEPSQADIAMTRQIARALDTVAIQMHDHVIVGHGRTVSLRSQGLLP